MLAEFFQRLVNVFVSPEKGFESIHVKAERSGAVAPLILLIIVGALSFQLVKPITEEMSREYVMKNERLTEEQRGEMLERMESGGVPVLRMISVIIMPIISVAAVASLFYFVGNFIGGGQANWLVLFITTAYIQCIDLVSSAVKVPLIISQKSMEVHTSLALLFNEVDYGNWLFKAAAQVDIFRIWKIVLWVIAFQVIYKFSRNKSVSLILSIFIIWSLISFFTMGFGRN